MPGPLALLRRVILGASGDPSARPPGPLDDFWYGEPGSNASTAGMRLSPDTALSVGAYYRGVSILANAVAQLPMQVFRRTYDAAGRETGKEVAKDHPLYLLLWIQPNAWQTSFEWRRYCQTQLLQRGNSYNLLVGNARGEIEQLVPLRSERMRVEQLANFRKRYRYTWDDGSPATFTHEQVVHLTALSTDGLCGLAPVTLARRTLGTASALAEFGARQFAQQPKPSVALKVPGKLDREQQEAMGTNFRRAWSGSSGWFGVPVLHGGMELQNIGMSNADAEFLGSRKFAVKEIAQWLGVPPHLLGDLEGAKFANIEHQGIDFLTYSLLPWLVGWEQRFTLDLCIDAGEDDVFVEFNTNALLRGDSRTRAETQGIYLDKGVLSPNEVRAIENRNPREGGDDYLMQVNATRPIGPVGGEGRAPPRRDDQEDDSDVS